MARQHVDFINDKDFKAIAGRSNVDAGDDHVTDIVHLSIRGGVDFQNVHRATFGNFATRRARGFVNRRAWRSRRLVRPVAVEAFGNQPRRRSFANAAGAGKQIRMMQPIVLERILKCAR